MSAPINDAEAEEAFLAYAAVVKCEVENPHLKDNPYWVSVRETAYARFRMWFEAS